MNDAPKPDNDKQSQDGVFFPRGFLWITLGTAILIAVVVRYSLVFDTLPGRYTFIGQNVLNVLLAAAVLAQVLIYRRQWDAMRDTLKQGRRALQISERAYVGVHSLERRPKDDKNMLLRIENLGRLPAHEITVRVDMILLVHGSDPIPANWWFDFQRTALFRGNLKLEILIPLGDGLPNDLLTLVMAGHARLIAQIRIEYRDGFRDTKRRRADYAFRFRPNEWLSWWVWTEESIEARCAEEKSRYPQQSRTA